MRLGQMLKKVNKTNLNKAHSNYDEFCNILEIPNFDWSSQDDFEKRFTSYWLTVWYCTDQHVGTIAHFLDNELIAVSSQQGRKSDVNITFTSKKDAEKVKNYILSMIKQSELELNFIDLDQEIDNYYRVQYAEQLLPVHNNGFVNNKACKLVSINKEDECVTVEFSDGSLLTVPVREFHINYPTFE